MLSPELGAIAVSKAGHDKGRAFVIIGRADENHVLLCDGDSRKLALPKKKKLRHVRIEQTADPELTEKLTNNAPLMDADFRKALSRLGYKKD